MMITLLADTKRDREDEIHATDTMVADNVEPDIEKYRPSNHSLNWTLS